MKVVLARTDRAGEKGFVHRAFRVRQAPTAAALPSARLSAANPCTS
jgi:hypothetical protein